MTHSARRIARRIAVGLGSFAVVVGVALGPATPADAHPLGNFTVNRYARVELSAGVVRVYYVLDEAEIPTFQEGPSPKVDPSGFASARVAELAAHLHLTIDGTVTPVAAGQPQLVLPTGQAGLQTLHLAVLFSAALPGAAGAEHTLEFSDANQPDHIGWREIIVTARGDTSLRSSTAPASDVSRELTSYPGNLIQSPLDLRHVTATFIVGSQAVAPLPLLVPGKAVARAGAGFAALIDRKHITLIVLLGLLGLAAGFGAVHALAPGHGKTIMAAYLVGTKGRPRDAVLLGTIVSVMHTASVLGLGAALYAISRNANPDRIYPYLKIVSGVAIGGWGIWLVAQRSAAIRRGRERGQAAPVETPAHQDQAVREPALALAGAVAGTAPKYLHHHGHAVHTHDRPSHDGHIHDRGLRGDVHDHGPGSHTHDHGPGSHTHELPEGVAPLSRRGLILLATGGGLFPSPSAVLVLISALELHRAGLGLALIAAFSVGLAASLTAVGLALVYGRQVVDRRGLLPALRWLPIVSAAAITVLGAAFAISGLTGVR